MHIVPQAESVEPPRERKDDLKPGMSNIKVLCHRQNMLQFFKLSLSSIFRIQIFCLILFGMICAIVLAVLGIMWYQKHKESSRKLW